MSGEQGNRLINELMRVAASRGYNTAYLAERLGVTPNAVEHWIAGKRTPSIRQLEGFVDALGHEYKLMPKKALNLPTFEDVQYSMAMDDAPLKPDAARVSRR